MHQLVDFGTHAALTICHTAYEVTYFWLSKMYMIFWEPISLKNEYEKIKVNATTYNEWKEAAEALDDLEGNEEWKQSPVSSDYDYELIHNRLIQLRKARELNDVNAIAFLLRTSITRNIGGIGNEKLYSISHIGTKHLIEEYIDEVGELLDYCAESKTDWKDIKSQIEFFKTIRHSFGNTALLLSGGAAMGSHHIGVIKCLVEHKCLPRIVSGSSAGAIVASIVCTRQETELPEFTKVGSMNWNILEEPLDPDLPHRMSIRVIRKLKRLFNQGVLFDNEILKKCMKDNLGDVTFIEAYNRTRRILNIAVSSNNAYQMPSLLNYITAPNVVIWSAVVASCALPAFYKSGKLQAKDPNGQIVPWNRTDESWIDGSVENDLPMKRVAQLFNVNHFIVSQVNPHIVPFIQKNLRTSFVDILLTKFLFLVKSELQYRLPMLIDIGIFPRHCRMLLNVLSQSYTGDITIVPDHIALNDLLTMFSSLNPERIKDATVRAERATWPKLSIIKNHTSIELKLDQILYRLKCRLLDLLYNRPESKQVVPEEKSMIENLMINMDSDLVHSDAANKMFGGYNGTPAISPSYYLDLVGRSKVQFSRPTYASQPALNYSSQPTLMLEEEDEEDEEEEEEDDDDDEERGDEMYENSPIINESDDEDKDQGGHDSTILSSISALGGYPKPTMNGQYKPVASAIVD